MRFLASGERGFGVPTKVALVIVFLKSKESALLFAMDMTNMAKDTHASPFCCEDCPVVRRITRPCTLRVIVSWTHRPSPASFGFGFGLGNGLGVAYLCQEVGNAHQEGDDVVPV